jgi:hypothetical protein
MSDQEFVKVRSASGDDRVAFWDPSTVYGEDGLYIVGDKVFDVPGTPEIMAAVNAGRLALVVEETKKSGKTKAGKADDAKLDPPLTADSADQGTDKDLTQSTANHEQIDGGNTPKVEESGAAAGNAPGEQSPEGAAGKGPGKAS